MPESMRIKLVCYLSYTLAVVVAAVSLGGLFIPGIYGKESLSWAAQGLGQDLLGLVLVFPLLILSSFYSRKGKKIFLFLLCGLLIYLVYSFVFYAFFMHFNRLFFLYCAAILSPARFSRLPLLFSK